MFFKNALVIPVERTSLNVVICNVYKDYSLKKALWTVCSYRVLCDHTLVSEIYVLEMWELREILK